MSTACVVPLTPECIRHGETFARNHIYEMMQMACSSGAGVLETRSVELASKYGVRLYLGRALEESEFRQKERVYYGKTHI